MTAVAWQRVEVNEQRRYAVTAGDIQDLARVQQITIRPVQLVLHVRNGVVWHAVVSGPTIRARDGGLGLHRDVKYGTADDVANTPPGWLLDIVTAEGLTWAPVAPTWKGRP